MNAGRVLDAIISKEVMGVENPCACFCNAQEWTGEKEDGACKHCHTRKYQGKHYSTDIAAAFEVVEKLFAKTAYTFDHCEGFVRMTVAWEGELIEVKSDKTPHVIALASLKAVGYEFSKED